MEMEEKNETIGITKGRLLVSQGGAAEEGKGLTKWAPRQVYVLLCTLFPFSWHLLFLAQRYSCPYVGVLIYRKMPPHLATNCAERTAFLKLTSMAQGFLCEAKGVGKNAAALLRVLFLQVRRRCGVYEKMQFRQFYTPPLRRVRYRAIRRFSSPASASAVTGKYPWAARAQSRCWYFMAARRH